MIRNRLSQAGIFPGRREVRIGPRHVMRDGREYDRDRYRQATAVLEGDLPGKRRVVSTPRFDPFAFNDARQKGLGQMLLGIARLSAPLGATHGDWHRHPLPGTSHEIGV